MQCGLTSSQEAAGEEKVSAVNGAGSSDRNTQIGRR